MKEGKAGMSFCVKVEVFITVENVEDVEEIANGLHEILCGNGITNSVTVTDEISE